MKIWFCTCHTTQYRLVQSGKTASGGCSAGQGSSEPVAPRIYYLYFTCHTTMNKSWHEFPHVFISLFLEKNISGNRA
jgi:hypothetical protein